MTTAGAPPRLDFTVIRPAGPVRVEDIEWFLRLLWLPGEVREVRSPKYNKYGHTLSGYFDSPEAMAKAIAPWDGCANLYVTLNPVNRALLARAANRINDKAEHTTSDVDVLMRRWMLLDIDPVRPSGISSTEEEREAAHSTLLDVVSFLSEEGWPGPITAMSGNGYYAFYRVDLPNDEASLKLVGGMLEALAARFNSPAVHIDTSVFNASRLAAIIGTLKMKGDSTVDRPHRRSALLEVPQ